MIESNRGVASLFIHPSYVRRVWVFIESALVECIHVHGWDGGNEQANERIGGKSLASVVSSFVRSFVRSFVLWISATATTVVEGL